MADAQPYRPRRALVESDPLDGLGQLRIALDQLASEWEQSAGRRGRSLLAQQEREHARQIDDLLRRLP